MSNLPLFILMLIILTLDLVTLGTVILKFFHFVTLLNHFAQNID